jgi:hypothetical protein
MLFGKREPTALELDFVGRQVVHSCAATPGRLFYGHGAYPPGGAVLYATELDAQTGVGAIVVRDAETLRVLGELPSHGDAPHDCRLLDGGRVMLVANAGAPGTYAGSSLTLVELGSGRLLRTLSNPSPAVHLTHFAVASDGTIVVSSAPNRNRPVAPGALFVAGPDGPLVETRLPAEVAERIHDETLSIAIAERRRLAAVTVPASNLVVFVHLADGSFAGTATLDRPAGVAVSPDGAHFVVGARRSLHWIAVDSLTEDRARVVEHDTGSISHLLIASS